MKIAIIGAGNMGGSIARGLAKGSLIDDSDIIVSNPSAGKLEKLKRISGHFHHSEQYGSGNGSRCCHSRREALVCGVRHARAEAEEQTDARIRSGRYQF